MTRQTTAERQGGRLTALYWTAFAVLVGIALWAGISEELALREQDPVFREEVLEETTLHPQEPLVMTSVQADFTAPFTDREITQAAQVVWGEARGVESRMEQAAVVWCMLNRVDDSGDSLGTVATAPNQFAYDPAAPTVDDYGRDLEELVRDVISRWEREWNGESGVGRVLPRGYLWFSAWDGQNHFRSTYDSLAHSWEWRLPDPYTDEGAAT